MHVIREQFAFRTYLGLSLLGVGCGLVGAMSGARLASNMLAPPMQAPVISVAATTESVGITSTHHAIESAPPAPSSDVGFVIQVEDTNYMILDVDPVTVDSHKPRLAHEEYANATIARVDLNDQLRAWRGQDVIVDGGCHDKLHDFALVHVLTGDPGYAGDNAGNSDGKWTLAGIENHGTPFVVAKLEHCSGTFARAATAPAAVKFVELPDYDTTAAQANLFDSQLSHDEARAYIADMTEQGSHDYMAFAKVTEVASKAVRDPRTGTTWITVHASAGFSCGGPDINYWGLYRVDGEHVTAIAQGKLDNIGAIEALVDLDGDGIPEILSGGWIEPTKAFYRASDLQPLASYTIPFFGCPC